MVYNQWIYSPKKKTCILRKRTTYANFACRVFCGCQVRK